jgi:AraC-like DNA-binding protein
MEKLHIKNMVCPRCISAVQQILDDLEIHYTSVNLGEIEMQEILSADKKEDFEKAITEIGFELIDDRKSRMIEKMKNLVVQKIHHSNDDLNIKWGDFIADQLNYDYKYLSMLFSSVESITLEQFIIRQKTERVKELIVYDELTLSEIGYQLGYSNVAHLSAQFKKITGMTPTQFKKTIDNSRQTLDSI